MGYHPFATERSLREIQALIEGQQFQNVDEINAHFVELARGGRISAMAEARKRDDPKWRAQELAYEALEAEDIVEALRLATEVTKLDPDCIDARRLMVSLVRMPLDKRIQLMREVVDKAERNLGESFFEDHAGQFWAVSTRPYMRAKQHLSFSRSGPSRGSYRCFRANARTQSRRQPGNRYPLLGLYLATNQPARATDLMSRYPDEERLMARSHGREF